jgi:predicted ferric reductase
MKYTYRRGFFWVSVFVVLALLPMIVAIVGSIPDYRGFWTELGVGLGFIGFGMFSMQFVFSGRYRKIAPTYGMDNILQFHRDIGILAVIFVLLHPLINIVSRPEYIEYFDPGVNFMRAIALIFVTFALILILATSIWRLNFGLDYEKWRLLHGFLALAILFIGAVHAIQVSHYLDPLWKKVMIGLMFLSYGYLVMHTRLVRPWLMRKKPYKVVANFPERGDCRTIQVEPVGHGRLDFICGQFVWITIGPSPFSLQQHPFSIASSARDKSLLFTAKETGDFTSSWKDITPGTKVFLEGPFGSFVPEKGHNLFLIMGGIGITPAMGMLRTMRDSKDPRPVILVYANIQWEDVTFREELDEISKMINLRLVHLLEKPPEGWKGETGLVTRDLLKKHMPDNPENFMFFICGPNPMMDITEISLRELGIDWRLIYSERFEII